jgi:hypothetical protein
VSEEENREEMKKINYFFVLPISQIHFFLCTKPISDETFIINFDNFLYSFYIHVISFYVLSINKYMTHYMHTTKTNEWREEKR